MKNRNIIELLKLLKETIINYNQFDFCGMCGVIDSMHGKLCAREWMMLHSYVRTRRPIGMSSMSFWWAVGIKRYRTDWIDEQINTLRR